MRTNSAAAGTVRVSPLVWLRSTRLSSLPTPWPSITAVWSCTSMVGLASITLTRYSDMLAASEPPADEHRHPLRMLGQMDAAWPAELPAPMT
jgi:hypothetical protein